MKNKNSLAAIFVAALVFSALCAGDGQGQIPTPGASPNLPDLTVSSTGLAESLQQTTETFTADSCVVQEACVRAPGPRRLLRFDTTIQNKGNADFVLGSPETNPSFSLSPCHGHYHLKNIMLYELVSPDGKVVAQVRKQGFCMEDMRPIAGSPGRNTPTYTCENQGLSPGWEDDYDASIDCQWLDVTGLPSGNYMLRLTVNPGRVYPEINPNNNVTETPVTLVNP